MATAKATAGVPWDGGVGPVAGDAVNPSLGAWPRHPCRGHPRNRTHPAFDSSPRSVGTAWPALGWPALGGCRPWSTRRSTPCVDEFQSKLNISTVDRSASTHGVDLLATGKLSKAGHCGFAGCEPHGCGDQASMDGFTASPQTHSAPPSHGMPLLLLLRPLLLLRQVQGAALPKTPYFTRRPERSMRNHSPPSIGVCPSPSGVPRRQPLHTSATPSWNGQAKSNVAAITCSKAALK
jgi:hypothetical protein